MNLISPDKKHLFWSADIANLDLQKHKQYIIHQVLQYGDISDYRWLTSVYSDDEIKTVFVTQPRKTYPRKTFFFAKNYLLKITNPLKPEKYVAAIS